MHKQYINCRHFNPLLTHYDMGTNVVQSSIDMEGNSSFPRSILLKVGGYHPQFYNGEGWELSYRTVRQFGDASREIYYPDAIIFLNYSTNFLDFLTKEMRLAKMRVILEEISTGIWEFVSSYAPLSVGITKILHNMYDRIRLAILWRVQHWLYTRF
jgi:hypothetical protein